MTKNAAPLWIAGSTRSGKTSRLIEEFCNRANAQATTTQAVLRMTAGEVQPELAQVPGVLVLAAIGDHRVELADRLSAATQGKVPFTSTTPAGFFQSEVQLFWMLLIQQLELKAQFPIRLTPETEQELATQLWRVELDQAISQDSGLANTQVSSINEARLVRRILDLLQLAAAAGVTIAEISERLTQGLAGQEQELPLPFEQIGEMLQRWQQWCLERGFLTYSLTATLYWQYLLPHPLYQQRLTQRFQLLLADDVDEYPAIARDLFEILLDAGTKAVFTFNPNGFVRLGLGADPEELARLADRCRVEELPPPLTPTLAANYSDTVVQLALEPVAVDGLPETFRVIQTTARSQLLRQIADTIMTAVKAGEVQPHDIAVISPGLDAIARYALVEILNSHQVPVLPLNDQRPLTSSPIIRALLTLLALVYKGIGRQVDRDAIAEMLVVLTRSPFNSNSGSTNETTETAHSATSSQASVATAAFSYSSMIDPVRAGLLADYCFAPHPERPRLLPVSTFPRWDRLGYQASTAYERIVTWIANQQAQLEQRLIPNAVSLLDRAIQHFLLGGGGLAFDQLSALRQLLETAQHYWEVNTRRNRSDRQEVPAVMTVSKFIQLLRSDVVTANPFPVRPMGAASNAVTLATVFQYRASHRSHRWQFWLDAGSPRWLSGVDALFAAPLFLRQWSGQAWTAADALDANENRLRRILLDLLARAEERIYLCHSDLATNGQEQLGVLLGLVNAATTLNDSTED
jgi:hypothetical protein